MIKKFEGKTPIFTKGRILKNEMLERLRDFPRQVADICWSPYADGVILGLDLLVDQVDITLTPGMIKYEGELLVLAEQLKVPYEANGREQILKLQFEDPYQTSDFEGRVVHVVLEDKPTGQHEMELARFNLSKGAYLRSDYQDFEDFKTGHNTLNIVNQPYSHLGGSTLSPAILKYFARALIGYQTENAHDIAIIYQVLNQQKSISKELLVHYIRSRISEDPQEMTSNEAIHYGLSQVLKKAKLEERTIGQRTRGNRRLIVD